jgi:hypothetical protein
MKPIGIIQMIRTVDVKNIFCQYFGVPIKFLNNFIVKISKTGKSKVGAIARHNVL